MRKLIAFLAGGIAWVVSGTAAFSAERSAGEVKELFEQKCGTCHALSRSTSLKKTAREWQRTVSRMKNSLGAQLTDQEATAIVEYLSKNHGE
jgi:cytochrome c5